MKATVQFAALLAVYIAFAGAAFGYSSYSSSPESGAASVIVGLMFLLVGVVFYFLPSIIAGGRHHHNGGAIFIINLLLGWTLVGWAVALAWSFTSPPPTAPTIFVQRPDGAFISVQTAQNQPAVTQTKALEDVNKVRGYEPGKGMAKWTPEGWIKG